jgi:hypothetical protein
MSLFHLRVRTFIPGNPKVLDKGFGAGPERAEANKKRGSKKQCFQSISAFGAVSRGLYQVKKACP